MARSITTRLRRVLASQGWSGPVWTFLLPSLAVLPMLLLFLRFGQDWIHGLPRLFPMGDVALLELGTVEVTKGAQLVGPYSRFGWSHIGPAYYLVLLPLYSLTRQSSLSLAWTALSVNLACSGAILFTARRTGDRPLYLSTVAMLPVLLTYLGLGRLGDPWNPFVTVVPFGLFLVLCAVVANGCLRALPIAAVVGSAIVQTHIAYLPCVLAVGGLGCAPLLSAGLRRWLGLRPVARRRVIRWVLLTGLVGIAVWSPPLIEQFTHQPGNLAQVFRFLRVGGDTHGIRESFLALSEQLAFPFSPILRRAEHVLAGREYGWAVMILGALQIIGVHATAYVAYRRGQQYGFTLGAVGAAGSWMALWSVVQIREQIFEYLVLWTCALGLVQWIAMATVIIPAIGTKVTRLPGSLRAGRLATVLVLTVVAIATTTSLIGMKYEPEVLVYHVPEIRGLYEAVDRYIAEQAIERPLIHFRGRGWVLGAGVVLQLDKAGISFAVEDAQLFMFGSQFAPNGREGAEILFADETPPRDLTQGPTYELIGDLAGTRVFVRARNATTAGHGP